MENAEKKEVNIVKEEETIELASGKKPKKVKKPKTKLNPDGTKKKRKPVKTPYFVLICVGLGVLGASLGCVGGYFLYFKLRKPPVYKSSFTDYVAIRERAEGKKDLLKEFEGEEYNLVNYAFDKYAHSKNTLTMSYGEADSANGIQTTRAVTVNGTNTAYNQNISTTAKNAIVDIHTAYRFYFEGFEQDKIEVHAYEKGYPKDWQDDMKETNVYDADGYMKKYGKLNIGQYSVDTSDKFVSLKENADTFIINGGSIYQFNSETVVGVTRAEKVKDQYFIDFTVDTLGGCKYYAKQIATNAQLEEGGLPTFEPTLEMQFVLDKNYNLVESFVKEQYDIYKVIAATCSSTMHSKYFSTNDDDLIVEGETIKVPGKGETFPLDMKRASSNKKDKPLGTIIKNAK